jgi:hypothetical protein
MNNEQIKNQQQCIIIVVIICVMIMLCVHHIPYIYVTPIRIFPQEILSTISGSVIGACVGYYIFITYGDYDL